MIEVINVSVEEELKEKADELFEELGTDTETAIRMFLVQALKEGGFPFWIRKDGF